MKEILIDRPDYIFQLNSWKNKSDIVKIITGVRRCGKSKLFSLFQSKLLSEGVSDKQIINVNLEDPSYIRKIGLKINTKNNLLTDYEVLLDFIKSKIKSKKMNYVFIDEIQLLENWQQVANGLRLKENVDLYLTGSNAYMFSGDLANYFGGRYIEIKMQPFSFKEYYSAYKIKQNVKEENLQKVYDLYIKESGFPQTTDFIGNSQLINDYLMNTVYLNTIQKDIVKRFNIQYTNKLDSVINYIFDNIGNETSVRNISKTLESIGEKTSVPSIEIYIKGLIDSYLIYKCNRYNIKGKQYLISNSKYYVADVGLRNILLGKQETDMGHILENIVYLELLRRGYKVYVGKLETFVKRKDKNERVNLKIDFVAQKPGQSIEYYQVAFYTLEKEILERELKPLEKIRDNNPKFILSMDYGNGDINGIKRLNVLDWLLK